MLSQFRLSVCPSVTRVDQSIKTIEVRITQFSPSPSRNSDGFLLSEGVRQGWGGKNKLFSSFMRQYLENGTRYVQSYY